MSEEQNIEVVDLKSRTAIKTVAESQSNLWSFVPNWQDSYDSL